MTVPVVRSETAGGVCTVTLDDPERKNALSAQLTSELMDALDAAEADDAVRVIVLTNTGNTFCAGANLSERSGRSEASSLRQARPRALGPSPSLEPEPEHTRDGVRHRRRVLRVVPLRARGDERDGGDVLGA